MVERSSQDFVVKHLYVSEGACLSICAKFMSEIVHLRWPKNADYLEAAQWVQELPDRMSRINLLAASAGLRQVGTHEGQLLTDEIYLGNFVQQVRVLPSFNLFGFLNTQRNKGHALLLFTFDGDHWNLLDPNFGIAVWTHRGGMLLGLKRLLENAYPDFGPYYRFFAWKYEK